MDESTADEYRLAGIATTLKAVIVLEPEKRNELLVRLDSASSFSSNSDEMAEHILDEAFGRSDWSGNLIGENELKWFKQGAGDLIRKFIEQENIKLQATFGVLGVSSIDPEYLVGMARQYI